jgi:hypothetical protein
MDYLCIKCYRENIASDVAEKNMLFSNENWPCDKCGKSGKVIIGLCGSMTPQHGELKVA